MSPLYKRFLLTALVASSIESTLARHVHRSYRHSHELRNIVNRRSFASSKQAVATVVPPTESVVKDLTDIESGIENLPGDLINLLSSLDETLKQEEALLSSWIGLQTSATGAPMTMSSVYYALSTMSEGTSSTTMASPTTAKPTSARPSLCAHGGAGPLTPCSKASSTFSFVASTTAAQSPSGEITTSTETSQIFSTINQTSTTTRSTTITTRIYTGTSVSTSGAIFQNYTTTVVNPSTNVTLAPPDATSSNGSVTTSIVATPSPTYAFKPRRNSNVAVYYGQTPATETGGLQTLCQDANVDIVILAFVTAFDESGEPAASFGPGCTTEASSLQQANAPGLRNCNAMAPEIAGCQALGKPVLVSLGGYYANVTLASDDAATTAAIHLWNLFGGGTANETLRPFGPDIVVDGFDLDNESHDPTSYTAFAQALRDLFAWDPSKTYYLSAAPQCPRPDASFPLDTLALTDFVFVQFYNNPSCNIDSSGFQASFAAWSNDLAALSPSTRVFIGVGGFEGAGSGYIIGSGLETRVSLVRELDLDNLGGVMVWDGSMALANVDQYGDDYLVYAKGSLQ